jgi:hypothetical protein
MKISKQFICAAAVTLAVSFLFGCKSVDIKDGKVPAAYIDQIQPLLGQYKGSFYMYAGNMTISLDEQRPKITLQNSFGNDWIQAGCKTKVGYLRKVYLHDNNTLDSAVFDFDRGGCREVRGRSITLDFTRTASKQIKINISYLAGYKMERECRPEVGGPPDCAVRERCTYNQKDVYYSGRFVK